MRPLIMIGASGVGSGGEVGTMIGVAVGLGVSVGICKAGDGMIGVEMV